VARAAERRVTRVEIVPYAEQWPREFARVERRLREALGERALRIDHIGSTAVPGLAAKDRIDVQVAVADLSDANVLGGAGFVEFAPVADHAPPWAEQDSDEWQKRLFQSAAEQRAANIHVRLEGRANLRYALLFRDYLREHRAAVAAYAELKLRLANELRDVGRYADVKDPACDLIMVAAEEWALATGWNV
jgi:GrpB-like predicted nucleotidyltransferase (UPF0157 family)